LLHGFAPSAPAVAVLSETVGIERQPPHGVGFDQFQKRRSAILRLAEKARDADVNFIPDIAAGVPPVSSHSSANSTKPIRLRPRRPLPQFDASNERRTRARDRLALRGSLVGDTP
jgi:hypothetical protein